MTPGKGAEDSRPPALPGFNLVITDSGLGGLLVCAGLESRLRNRAGAENVRLTYVNAWPDEAFGYNDLPDIQARASMFDRALSAMALLQPALILVACNTLSVLLGQTEFVRRGDVPCRGIVEAAADLFAEALAADRDSRLTVFGTKTTVGSGVYRDRLLGMGFGPERFSAVACHGLAAAVENDPDGPEAGRILSACAAEACRIAPPPESGVWLAGLACTHYGYIKDAFRVALEKRSGRSVQILDPNDRLVLMTAGEIGPALHAGNPPPDCGKPLSALASENRPQVEVVSKVVLGDEKRRNIARRLEKTSKLTAQALLDYKHRPDLF